MTVGSIAALLVLNLAYVFVGTALLWGLRGWDFWAEPMRLAGLSYFLGLAAFVVLSSAGIVVGIPFGIISMLGTGLVLVVLGLVLGAARGRQLTRVSVTRARWRPPRLGLFVALTLAGLVLWLEASFRAARLQPPWAIDAWRVWTVRAKLLYFDGGFEHVDLGASLNAYPPGLSLLQAQAFEAMHAADAVTLHLQHWFFAAGFVAAMFGLLARRVRGAILAPVVLLTLVMPASSDISIWPVADPLLGYLAAVAAVLLCLWLEDGARWRLETVAVILACAVLMKREAAFVVVGLYVAGGVAAWSRKRRLWPQLALATAGTLVLSASWRLGLVAAGRSDAPTEGYLSFLDAPDRGFDSLRLVASTYVTSQWAIPLVLTATAVLLAVAVRHRSTPIFVGSFLGVSVLTSSFLIWSEPFLRISQDLSLNPVVRMTLVVVVVLCPLTALMLEDAWSGSASRSRDRDHAPATIARPSVRNAAAWGLLTLAVLAYPGSAILGIGGPTLPGGRPLFPGGAGAVARSPAVSARGAFSLARVPNSNRPSRVRLPARHR